MIGCTQGVRTVVGSLAVLLLEFVSPDVATVAVLVTPGAAVVAGVTVRPKLELAFGARIPVFVQVTVCPEALQFHPAPAPETYVRPVGSVSVTVIVPVVPAPPTFVTAMLYTPFVPTMKLPLCCLVIVRSGCVGSRA